MRGPGGPGGHGGMGRGPGGPPPPMHHGGWGHRRGCCGPGCLMFVLGTGGIIALLVAGLGMIF